MLTLIRRRILAGTVVAVAAAALTAPLFAQALPDLGFERRDASGRLFGWGSGGNGYRVVPDSSMHFGGSWSLRSQWMGPGAWTDTSRKFGVASTNYPVALAQGRKLHLTGYIRTDSVTSGYAGLWMRVDGAGRTLSFDNMSARGVKGTTGWTRYDIELPVDSGASNLVFGVIHPGNGTAWFDSLTLEVVGPPMPRTASSAPPFRPVPRPIEDMTRLLTDAELALPPDTGTVPAENGAWTDFARANAHPIRSLGATEFSDLAFFKPLLEGKRIVQLGESGHGVAEFDLTKVRLIKYLHEELGYDVIAFESSVYECNRAQHDIATLSADALMRSCIFGVWHTAETLPLFVYIKQTQSTTHPLVLAGFDEQTSGSTANSRPAFFHAMIARIDTTYARAVARSDSTNLAMFRSPDKTPLTRDQNAIVAFYDSLATWLRVHERALVNAMPDDPNAPLIARQAALSMKVFTRQLALGPAGSNAGYNIRDRGMADNLDFLLDDVFPGKKVMVWAHNFHIQARRNVAVGDSAGVMPKSMGVWVSERHRPETYTIGLFMYRGSAATNARVPYPVSAMHAGSMESVLHRVPWRYSFIDVSQPAQSPATSWMYQKVMTMQWGNQPDPLVPRDEYDGIVFIDTTHPPTYIPMAQPPRAQ